MRFLLKDQLGNDRLAQIGTRRRDGGNLAGKKRKAAVCDICGKMFVSKGNMNKHVKAVHNKVRPFKCDICGTCFSFRDVLRRHVDYVHGY